MSNLKSFYLHTTPGIDVLNVGHEVRRALLEGAQEEGQVLMVIPHPGAGLVIMELEAPPAQLDQLKKELLTFQQNGLIRCFLPKSIVLPFEKGRMSMEPWQDLFLIDYDTSGKRREFRVQVSAPEKDKKAGGK